MEITVRKKETVGILEIAGNLTLGAAEAKLRDRFQGLLDAGESRFIVKMSAASYIDSVGLAELVACRDRARRRGGLIKFVLSGKPYEICRITGVDQMFEIYETEEEALASFASASGSSESS
jgi:anti-anti-sigma factor